jgi:hypothetical protein
MIHAYCNNPGECSGVDCGENCKPSVEEIAYALVHEMAQDIVRLAELVMETRCAANWRVDEGIVFRDVTDRVMEGEYLYTPAMDRYLKLYGDEAMMLRGGAIDWEAYED